MILPCSFFEVTIAAVDNIIAMITSIAITTNIFEYVDEVTTVFFSLLGAINSFIDEVVPTESSLICLE